jgi:transcriptional regulator with XRE-family HTH domain
VAVGAPARNTETVTTAGVQHPPFGSLMKQWRRRRRISQLDLAIEADVSSRHVSFIETGRSVPSRAMVLRIADALDVPLREQNRLLMAAGLAPVYGERSLDDDDMAPVRDGVDKVLKAYEPYPCLAVDRGWNVVATNAGVALLLNGVAPHLLDRPNALRVSLHPEGLAPRIRNLGQWRHHVIGRLRREVAVSGSAELSTLLAEIESYPGGFDDTAELGGVVVPLEIDGPDGAVLTFLSTVTTFGTALDLTAAELSIEAFLPADAATAAALA